MRRRYTEMRTADEAISNVLSRLLASRTLLIGGLFQPLYAALEVSGSLPDDRRFFDSRRSLSSF
jgi:hypothetical protein